MNNGARGPAGSPAEFVALVDSLKPKVHAPTGYEAHFGSGTKNARALVEGQGHLELPTGNGRGPSFTAEAGKPLTVTVAPERVLPSTEKLELVWRTVPGGNENVIPLTTGERDASGKLKTVAAKLEVPADADGLLRVSLRSTSNGRTSDSWDPSYDVAIAPRETTTLVFSESWETKQDKPVRAGDSLRLAYDSDRVRALFGGREPKSVSAWVSFNGDKAVEVPLTLQNGAMALPTIKVPNDATSMAVWFKGDDGGNTTWDSNFQKNFNFAVSPTRDDLDPSWKAEMLRSTSFPNLKADRFVGIGPSSERYNCIAWTVGKRNEWVWPGTKLEDFDRLYAGSGYRPLDTLDYSHDPQLEKVVVYALPGRNGAPGEVTHGALQDDKGRWTSKIGTQPLIRHQTPEDLAGPSYGQPVRVYARPRQPGGVS